MVMGDLPAIGALTHMSRVTQSVYAALLRVHVKEQGWGDVVSSQVSQSVSQSSRPVSQSVRQFSQSISQSSQSVSQFGDQC